MKKQELYDFIGEKCSQSVANIANEIKLIEDEQIDTIIDELDIENVRASVNEFIKKQEKYVEELGSKIRTLDWSQQKGASQIADAWFGTYSTNTADIRVRMRDQLTTTDEVKEKNKLIELTRSEFGKLHTQVQQLSTAKKGYELLIELGFSKDELDEYVKPKANALVVQNFDNKLLQIEKG